MKFENCSVFNFENAIRGMRNPMNSWNMSDSIFGIYHEESTFELIDEIMQKYYTEIKNELLNYEGFDDYKIRSSKCDRKLYEYISRGELKPKFSKAYLNAFSYVKS